MFICLLYSAHDKPFIAVGGGGICLLLALKRAVFIVNYFDCYLDLSLHHMLKMSTLSANTGTKTLAPLLDCVIIIV
jgi:hypothetical protein